MNYYFNQCNHAEKTFEEPYIVEHPAEGALWILPLGGLGEIGKNMMVLETMNDIIVIDAGIMFPTEDMLGIDYVIPDIRYLIHKKDKIRALILTHGHEDHIGAIPYIVDRIDERPIYGTRLTLEILRAKLREFEIPSSGLLSVIKPGEEVALGDFNVRFFRVVHSIAESVGLIIDTPAGKIVHSGDFKFDSTPIDGGVADFASLEAIPPGATRLLLSDSTYAERPGHSFPESAVGKTLDDLFENCPGRIIISTFSSSIPRIQQIITLAQKHEKKLCVHGRGMESILTIGNELGYFSVPGEMLVKIEDIRNVPDERLLILATGSQGEPLSALSLMATSSHKWVKIKKGDTVIISATPVPGNESLVHSTINSLFRIGAEVIYEVPFKSENVKKEDFHIHVSGHGSREELKMLITLVNPECFVPIHGEIRHLVHHARLARDMGIQEDKIFQLEDGDILELSKTDARLLGRLSLDNIMIDGLGVGDIGRSVLKDRQIMSDDGICVMVAVIDGITKELIEGPLIETRGLIYAKEAQDILDEAIDAVRQAFLNLKKSADIEFIKNSAKSLLRRFFQSRIKRRPLVVPMIIEI
jgi:ribonuclease J